MVFAPASCRRANEREVDPAKCAPLEHLPLPHPGARHSFRRAKRDAAMTIAKSVLDLIGNTPLVRLRRASEATGCEILGKAEFLNPGQSVKDRAALWIVRAAERDGSLKPGGTIVEGHGRQHRDRPLARRQGARLSLRHRHPRHAVGREEAGAPDGRRDADRSARGPLQEPEQLREGFRALGRSSLPKTEKGGAIWANQFDNVANRQAHIEFDRPGDLGGDRRQGRRLRLRRRDRRHARRRRHVPEGQEPGDQDRPRRRARRRALQFLCAWGA